MATRDTEGRREIEAAKQRLSIAKSHKTFLSKTLATAQASEDATKKAWKRAKRAKEEIQTQATSSEKEVSNAQKFLAEAEKRWEVISIDIDDDTSKKGKESSSNKNKHPPELGGADPRSPPSSASPARPLRYDSRFVCVVLLLLFVYYVFYM